MSRKNEVYNYIKEGILSNRFAPGTALKEVEIATALGTSRTPVREALRSLEAEGLVTSFSNRGVFVTEVSIADVEDISQLRELMEVWCLERSFEWIMPDEIDTVKNAFQKAKEDGKWESMHEADRMLHRMFIRKSGSKRAIQFMDTLNTQIERIRRVSAKYQGRNEISYEEHMNIIEAMVNKDLDACKEMLAKHLKSVGRSAMAMARTVQASGIEM